MTVGLFKILCMPCYISLELSVESLVKIFLLISLWLLITPLNLFDFVYRFLSCAVKASIWLSVFLWCFLKLCFVSVTILLGMQMQMVIEIMSDLTVTTSKRVWIVTMSKGTKQHGFWPLFGFPLFVSLMDKWWFINIPIKMLEQNMRLNGEKTETQMFLQRKAPQNSHLSALQIQKRYVLICPRCKV